LNSVTPAIALAEHELKGYVSREERARASEEEEQLLGSDGMFHPDETPPKADLSISNEGINPKLPKKSVHWADRSPDSV
jgi:hypothetical protein